MIHLSLVDRIENGLENLLHDLLGHGPRVLLAREKVNEGRYKNLQPRPVIQATERQVIVGCLRATFFFVCASRHRSVIDFNDILRRKSLERATDT